MKTISVLGSTGSIGVQTLEVASEIGLKVIALTANKNVELLYKQALQFKPRIVAVYDKESYEVIKEKLSGYNIKVLYGMDGLIEASTAKEADIVVTAVVGMVGLLPTIAAIESGKDIALANKETLVCAGEIVMEKAKEYGVKILPVDSEHSAIFQCLQGKADNKLNKIILTASGGPFFGKSIEELKNMKKETALKHPNWDMGAKITIDSATLMNKGLEFIEAMWLYNTMDIEVVVHRESIIHSLIEFEDNSVLAQLGVPDMKLPIQYAITYPSRIKCNTPRLSLTDKNLTFYKPDMETFSCLPLAIEAAEKKGNLGAILNGANEAAVELFLHDKISFLDIAKLVRKAMNEVEFKKEISLDIVIESDKKARECVYKAI